MKQKEIPTKEEFEEEEVITFQEFAEKHKDIKEEELHRIVLVCKNCGHKDLLKNFLKERERRKGLILEDYDIQPTPFKPTPYPKPMRFEPRWTTRGGNNNLTSSKTTKIMTTLISKGNYEDMFYCPKCGSSLVVLCREFIKNNVARLL